jgi:acetolactate synthase-1/2/3 large subunit
LKKISDYIAQRLKKYTDHAFIGQGSSILHLLHSIKKYGIITVASQNEQGASIAADAYSRSSNKLGLVVTTSGPGTINAFQGIACSHYDSVPCIYLSGAPIRKFLKKKTSSLRQLGFQEMDMKKITKEFTKYSVRIDKPNMVKYEIEKSIHLSLEGRPGPCLIEIPDDIQRAKYIPSIQKKYIPKNKKKLLKKKDFNIFKNLIANSLRPLIIIGNGLKMSNSEQELYSFIHKYQIPFVLTYGAADLSYIKPNLYAGPFGVYASKHGNLAVQNSDLLIILGCKMNPTLMGSDPKKFAPKAKKILIDIDEEELKQQNHLKINLKINLDLKDFFKKLKYAKIKTNSYNSWIKKILKWKKNYPTDKKEYYQQKKYVNPYVFFRKLSNLVDKNTIIINDTSNNMVWMHQSFLSKKGQKIFSAYNHSPMGYSVAASIGAQIANPKKNIIAIIGDGGMQMNIQEIQNIYHLNLPIKVFIINNKCLGMVAQAMDTWFNKEYVGCDLKSGLSFPDFNKVISAYKIRNIKIKSNKEIDKKLKKCLSNKKAFFCVVDVNPNSRMIPKVKLGDALDKI